MNLIKLYPHQEEALEKTKFKNKVAYYLDMGLGKTFVGSEKMKDLGEKGNLLICQKSKIEDWIEHFEEFYDYEVYNLRDKKEFLKFIESDNEKIGIINYELTFRRKELLEIRNFTLMLDESSFIKNPTAKRTKFVMKMKFKNVILLSGTPVGGKYEELFSQMRLLGIKMTKKEFYNRFIITYKIDVGGLPIEIVTGYKNVNQLKRLLGNNGAVFMKTEEVIDLPTQNDIKLRCKNTPEYRKFKKHDYVKLKGNFEVVGSNSLTRLLGLRQLASLHNKNKFDSFADLLESTNDRLIVFYNFTAELEKLKEICKDRPISEVNGQKRDLKNYKEKENSITFIQYQAGATGLNLQLANKIVYFSPTLSAEMYMQSKKRIHRIGQEKACFYYYLTTEGSVENNIYRSLEKGEDYTNKLFEKEILR